jgi:uncharacterized RDD family membrane protein YckC
MLPQPAASPPRGATVGKRLLRLRVIDERTRALPSGPQAIVRNLIKITVPWELGHTMAWVSPTWEATPCRSGYGCSP